MDSELGKLCYQKKLDNSHCLDTLFSPLCNPVIIYKSISVTAAAAAAAASSVRCHSDKL